MYPSTNRPGAWWVALFVAVAPLHAAEPGASAPADSAVKYQLRTGDRVQYRVAEDPVRATAPLVVPVNSVGEASFPVSRDSDIRITLLVRGKSLSEVKTELTDRLLADYYHKATVELALSDKLLTPGKIQFFGELRGTIPILPDTPALMLSDAVLQMGASDFADLKRIKIHRMDPVTQQVKEIVVDIRSVLKDGEREKDVQLLDGDRVEVPQKWIN